MQTPKKNSPANTRDPEATRQRILSAAMDLFVEKGYADVAMRQIAERSGVTKSLIHHHFGSKEALWKATKEAAFELYAGLQRQDLTEAEQSDEDLLRRGVVNYFKFLQSHPEVVRLFAWAHLERDTCVGENDAGLVRLGAERIRQAQENGIFRSDVNPVHVITTFVITCTHWFEAQSHHSQWEGIGSNQEFLDDFLKIFLDGLKPRHAPAH
ncbi:MAG: TetR/AcrR family transcriptional regulator [Wenzhouxiangella sp.]|jgi:TetR/AcrR family transcriptional regulator|nr:TetR/AcrR family transcriptional regulator [Wenzhouxiangella sp.]